MQLEQFIKAKVLQETIQAKIDDLKQLKQIVLNENDTVHFTLSQYPRFWQCEMSAKSAKWLVEKFTGFCEETIAKLQKDFDSL